MQRGQGTRMVLAGVALSAGIAWQGCSSRLTPPELPPPEYEPARVLASASASSGQALPGEAELTARGSVSTVGELDGGVGDAEWEAR
jgi:hypothetical protein